MKLHLKFTLISYCFFVILSPPSFILIYFDAKIPNFYKLDWSNFRNKMKHNKYMQE